MANLMKKPFKYFPVVILLLSIMLISVCIVSCDKNNAANYTKVKCVTCLNGGSCIRDTCQCIVGYEGQYCEISSAPKYFGSWRVSENGSISGYMTYQGYMSRGSNRSELIIQNIGDGSSNTIIANINRDSIFIPDQLMVNKRIVGIGKIYKDSQTTQYNTINLAYMLTDTLTLEVDDFGYKSGKIESVSVWTR